MSSPSSLQEVVAAVRSVDSIGLPLGPGQPVDLIHALGERNDWERLDVICSMLVDFYALFDHPGVHALSMFYGPAERIYSAMGRNIEFIPADFRRFALVFEQRAPRVMATSATLPDDEGWMSLSVHAGATVDELHRAAADPHRLLVVEASASFPRTRGVSDQITHRIHVDDVDMWFEGSRPPVVLADPEIGDTEREIARFAADFVRNGSTLQTGFGSIPSTIAGLLVDSDLHDLGVHSEMFTNGLMKLHQQGRITNSRKGLFDGFSVSTFAAGTPDLYEWLDDNDDVRFAPVSVVNSPEVIAAHHDMVTINGAIAVDLFGQITADTIAGNQFSGIGGHDDFVASSGLAL